MAALGTGNIDVGSQLRSLMCRVRIQMIAHRTMTSF